MSGKQKNPLYLPAPFFMLRAPTNPIEDFFRLLSKDNLGETLICLFKSNRSFRHAILIASNELYNEMSKIDEKGEKQIEQLISTLLKYFLRMTSRSTPFGLFSFIAMGKWEEKANGCFDHFELKKIASPDMEWLMQVIDNIVENPDFFQLIPVMVNPLLTYTSDRIYLNYIRKKGKDERNQAISIRSNILIKSILKFANSSISINELEKKLFIEFPNINQEKTRWVIEQLIKQQILISSLYPSLLTDSTFNDFLKKLPSINSNLLPNLQQIQKQIENYNNSFFEQGEEILLNLYQLMAPIANVKNFLQVDLICNEKKFSLPFCLQKNLSELCDVVWKVSTLNGPHHSPLKDCHAKFLEKYGTFRRIPLLELLDDNTLGISDLYLNNSFGKLDKPNLENKWKKWIYTQWNLCLLEGKKEIILTDQIIDQFFDKTNDARDAPLSFDLICTILAKSPEMINQDDYCINLIACSSQAGNVFGRFLNLLGHESKELVRELYKTEEKLDKGRCFVETSYFPSFVRNANVATHQNLRSHKLDLADGEQKSIQIKDIYVGANDTQFYLTNHEGTKEWIFKSGNMLIQDFSPIAFRFLRDISHSKHGSFKIDVYNDFNQNLFLPRVSYKRMILSAAEWNVDIHMLDGNEKSTPLFIEEKLKLWMDRWGIPRYVFLAEGDNQILLDRDCEVHVKELGKKIKNRQRVRLVEKIDQDNKFNWISSPLGTHLSEIVIPFTRHPNYFLPEQPISFPRVLHIPSNFRTKGIGSDWLYLKIYVPERSQNDFILNSLFGLTDFLIKEQMISQWFFVRYHDKEEGAHLRVRFQGKENVIWASGIPVIRDWAADLFEKRFICNLDLGTYEREIERYGGEKLIEAVEKFFWGDTLTTIELLKMLNRKENKLPNYVVAAIDLIDLAKHFAPLFENTPSDCQISSNEDKNEVKGIREWKMILVEYSKKIFGETTHFPSTDEWILFSQAFQKRENQLNFLVQLMKDLQMKQEITTPISSLYQSLVHMLCNRLMGVNHQLEKKGRAYAHYVLKERRLLYKSLQSQ